MKALLPFLLLAATACAADEKPAQPQPFTHRVTGLFAPDCEKDLRAALEKVPAIKLVSVDYEHAEAVFSYDPAVAFNDTKPEKIVERLDEWVRNASRGLFGIQPVVSTPREKLTRVELRVSLLDCKACALAAYEAVYKIDGLAQATVDFKAGRVSALIDAEKTNVAALEDALKKKGVEIPAK